MPGRGHLPPCVGPFSTLGAIGPMARTMGDVAMMFGTLSGQDPEDPASPPVACASRGLEELRGKRLDFLKMTGWRR